MAHGMHLDTEERSFKRPLSARKRNPRDTFTSRSASSGARDDEI